MRKIKTGILILSLLICLPSYSQQLLPKGEFREDSVRIGYPVSFALKFSYPKELQVVFPDSTYDFSPFELSSREYFPTVSDSVTSIDSAIYYLISFEIDPIQTLLLPVYIIQNEDSTVIETDIDSIYFSETIPVLPDTIVLKENTSHNPLEIQFNYPLLALVFLGILIVGFVLYLIFGKNIRQRIRNYLLKKEFRKFVQQYDESTAKVISKQDSQWVLKSVVIWKKFMEKLTKLPYTKMTTREIGRLNSESKQATLLKSLDKSIYGEQFHAEIVQDLEHLKEEAEKQFNQELQETENE